MALFREGAVIAIAMLIVMLSGGGVMIKGTHAQADVLAETTIPPWLDAYGATPNITLTLAFPGVPPISQHHSNGLVLTINQTSVQPRVYISGPSLDSRASYALLCIDPDAYNPSTPLIKNVIHWIISNIPGSSAPSQDNAKIGDVVLHFVTPRKPTLYPSPYGIHRYYNLLFKQAHHHKNIQNITSSKLSKFDTRSFIKKYNLGYPLAGTIFKVDIDS